MRAVRPPRAGAKGAVAGRLSLVLLAALFLALLVGVPAFAQTPRQSVTVVMDDNYPPYVFRDSSDQLRGILPEIWDLWSKKSGIPVKIEATDWAEAKRRFNDGEADVIDTIFRTPEREKTHDFSEPYATLQVPIYFSADLSGISDARSLRGFTVGVKDGDACIDFLQSQGIDSFHPYPSYEALIDAAGKGEVKTLCVDQPPASYFLIKKGLEKRFRFTEPLYSGQFHWAVPKSADPGLKTSIESGFKLISANERQAIEKRWMGQTLGLSTSPELLRNLRTIGLAALSLGLLLTGWVWILRRQVTAKTRDLSRTMHDLALSEARFRSIFDSINDAIFIQDAQTGAVLLVNRRAEKMYGWTQEEFLTLDMSHGSEGTPPYDLEHALAFIQRSAVEPQIFEWHARRKDRSLFWAEVSIRRAFLDGETERILVMVRDISERKEASDHLNRTVEALTRSNTDLESFAHAASHDLREPLNVVTRYSQMLESRHRAALGPNGAEAVDFILKGVRQMTRLVDGLLDYARVDSGDSRHVTLDMEVLVSEVLEILAPRIEETAATIEVTPLPSISGDPVQMTQLVQNLIGNAIKYHSPERPPHVIVSGRQLPDGTCEFRVCDNGIGIAPAYREQVFVIFKRLHTHDSIPGGGIGLALCKRIVERHSGRIHIEGSPEGGACFVFTIRKAEG